MGHAVIVTLAFDEGPGAGLGHRRRVEALSAELAARGHDCTLHALGTADAGAADLIAGDVIEGDVVIVDSYRVRADEPGRLRAGTVVAIDDLTRDLAVDMVVDPSPGARGSRHTRARRVLAGAAYALVPAAGQFAAGAAVDDPVCRVLVTTGATDTEGLGARIAEAVLAALPAAEVRLVVGRWGAATVPAGVVAVQSPDGLGAELAAAGIVVTAGGVTMLEACRLGRPVIALALADNQRQAVAGLTNERAVVSADLSSVGATVLALAEDPRRRAALAIVASSAIDGKGPTRVADAIEQLLVAR